MNELTKEGLRAQRVELNIRLKHGDKGWETFMSQVEGGASKEEMGVALGISASRAHKIMQDLGVIEEWKAKRKGKKRSG